MIFYILSYFLIFLGIACLPICEQMYIHFAMALFLFTFAYIAHLIKKLHLSQSTRQFLMVISVLFVTLALINTKKIGEWQLVWMGWYLILCVQVIYLFQPRTSSKWLFSYLLSTLQLGIAAEYTKNPAFFIFYITFLILSPLGFSLLLIRAEIKESLKKFLKPKLPYIKWVSLVTLNVFFFTAIIFVLLPRTRKPLLATRGKDVLIQKIKQTGVSDSEIMKGEKFSFPSHISLGEVSKYKRKDTILMLIETDKPLLWRVKAFNEFEPESGTWSITTEKTWQFQLENGTLRLQPVYLSQASLIRMQPEQFLHHRFFIKNFVGHDLPVAYQVLEIENLPAKEIKIDPLENIFLLQQLKFNTTYNMVSIHKTFSPSVLRSLPRKYPPEIKKLYLDVPPDVDKRIVELTAKILKDVPPVQYDEVATLYKFLTNNYTYTTYSLSGKNQLSKFLFEEFQGDCEYFATALAIMLRIAGVPSRLVIGFSKGDYDPVSRTSIITPRYAHAWVEVYFPEMGWLTCDPVPGGVNTRQWADVSTPEISKSEILAVEGKELIPPEEKVTPPEEEITPPEEKVTPPEEEITPPEEEVTPPEEEITPPEEEVTPPEEEITPPEEEVTPPEEEGFSGKILKPVRNFLKKMKNIWEKWILEFSYNTQRLLINKIKIFISRAISFLTSIISRVKYNFLSHQKTYTLFFILILTASATGLIIRRLHKKNLEKERISKLLPPRKLTREEKKIADFYFYILHLLEKNGYKRPKYLTPREFAYFLLQKGVRISRELLYLTEMFYKVSFGKIQLPSSEMNKVNASIKIIKEWSKEIQKVKF